MTAATAATSRAERPYDPADISSSICLTKVCSGDGQ